MSSRKGGRWQQVGPPDPTGRHRGRTVRPRTPGFTMASAGPNAHPASAAKAAAGEVPAKAAKAAAVGKAAGATRVAAVGKAARARGSAVREGDGEVLRAVWAALWGANMGEKALLAPQGVVPHRLGREPDPVMAARCRRASDWGSFWQAFVLLGGQLAKERVAVTGPDAAIAIVRGSLLPCHVGWAAEEGPVWWSAGDTRVGVYQSTAGAWLPVCFKAGRRPGQGVPAPEQAGPELEDVPEPATAAEDVAVPAGAGVEVVEEAGRPRLPQRVGRAAAVMPATPLALPEVAQEPEELVPAQEAEEAPGKAAVAAGSEDPGDGLPFWGGKKPRAAKTARVVFGPVDTRPKGGEYFRMRHYAGARACDQREAAEGDKRLGRVVTRHSKHWEVRERPAAWWRSEDPLRDLFFSRPAAYEADDACLLGSSIRHGDWVFSRQVGLDPLRGGQNLLGGHQVANLVGLQTDKGFVKLGPEVLHVGPTGVRFWKRKMHIPLERRGLFGGTEKVQEVCVPQEEVRPWSELHQTDADAVALLKTTVNLVVPLLDPAMAGTVRTSATHLVARKEAASVDELVKIVASQARLVRQVKMVTSAPYGVTN